MHESYAEVSILKFVKMHGAGNDYIYVDARGMDEDWPSMSVELSERHTGVGADGLILALESDRADIRMRMFNADGSEAEMCGNGIRCLVAFALTRGIVPKRKTPVVVETLAGDLPVTPSWSGGKVVSAKVGMGEPRLAVDDIPVALDDRTMLMDYPLTVDGVTFEINAVSMGNPHAVSFVDDPVGDIPLDRLGPLVECHPLFPNRVNFEIVNVIDGRQVRARIWERGSGETMASGTGACAVGVMSRLKRRTRGREVRVCFPGGDLIVGWPGEGEVTLEGPVSEVFTGQLSY